MPIQYEYLVGYCTSLLLALSCGCSVYIALMGNMSLGLSSLFSLTCFSLNLLLYWRDFGAILQSFSSKQSSYTDYIAIMLTLCSSLIMYAFTILTMTELRAASSLVFILLPHELVHLTAFANALGTYGLYIDDCKELLKTGLSKELRWSLLYTMTLFLPGHSQLALVASITMMLYHYEYSRNPKQALPILLDNLAAFASIILCFAGYLPSLALLYQPINIFSLQLLVKIIAYVGLIALGLCDIQFSINAIRKFTQQSPTKVSLGLSFMLSAALLNAVANSAISAGSHGLMSLNAMLGGCMSYIVGHNNMVSLSEDSTIKPPYYQNTWSIWQLALTNISLIMGYQYWLKISHPKQHQQLSIFFGQKALGVQYKNIAASLLFGAHVGLAKTNIGKETHKHQP